MRHGSLFSGIGGFDLAAEWMGWDNVFHCEWNKFGQKVLKHYWPQAESFSDITKTDFTKYYGTVDIITGGFPCQPYSQAGKRKGKEDERHLWPEMLRAIREIAPRFVVGENVRGLTNWNGGLVFEEVCTQLENLGYQVAPVIIPACAVNAPHRRERIWFVAYNYNNGLYGTQNGQSMAQGNARNKERENETSEFTRCANQDAPFATNTNGNGLNQCNGNDEVNTGQGGEYALNDIDQVAMHTDSTIGEGKHIGQKGQREFNRSNSRDGNNDFQNFPTQSPICSGDDGLPRELDGITFSKWRAESIKGYGNAIVPQVAYQIFKALEICK